MKEFWTRIALIVVAIIAVSAVRSCVFEQKEREKLSEQYGQSLREGKEATLEAIRTVTDTVYKVKADTYVPIETTDPSMYVSKGYADTLALALNIATKDIERLERYKITLEDSIKGLLTVDESGVQWASIKDNIFDIRYNIDSNIFYPRVSLGLDIISHPYKRHFFARREIVNTVIVPDHRIQISNVRQVNKVTMPSRFGIDLTAGAVLTPHGLTYGVGAGLGYRLIEF